MLKKNPQKTHLVLKPAEKQHYHIETTHNKPYSFFYLFNVAF